MSGGCTRRRSASQSHRAGAVLLEALVSLVVLATVALAVVTLGRQMMHSTRQAADAERELERASAFLGVVTLWSRDELDQRLGERRQGDWLLRIDRERAMLYSLTLMDSGGHSVLLRTSVYRPKAPGR